MQPTVEKAPSKERETEGEISPFKGLKGNDSEKRRGRPEETEIAAETFPHLARSNELIINQDFSEQSLSKRLSQHQSVVNVPYEYEF